MSNRPVVDVAVAVLQKADGRVLWCSRPEGKPYAHYWEFPGGKVEPGEGIWQALVREIDEELGIKVLAGGPWFVIDYDYPHARVRLHFMRVWDFQGEPVAKEGQQFAWDTLTAQATAISPILPATLEILPRLALPSQYWLSRVTDWGLEGCLTALDKALLMYRRSSNAAERPAIQFREKSLSAAQQQTAVEALIDLTARHGCPLLINSESHAHVWQRFTANAAGMPGHVGVHWTEVHLQKGTARVLSKFMQGQVPLSLETFSQRIQIASVHSRESINLAHAQGMHAVVLGTVQVSQSHLGKPVLGWDGFAKMVSGTPLPVYAIGGLKLSDLRFAQQQGAHGIAVRHGWAL